MTDIREYTCPICDGSHTGDRYDCHDVRGLICQREGCGKTIQFPVTYQGLGCFCSHQCAALAVSDKAEHMKGDAA